MVFPLPALSNLYSPSAPMQHNGNAVVASPLFPIAVPEVSHSQSSMVWAVLTLSGGSLGLLGSAFLGWRYLCSDNTSSLLPESVCRWPFDIDFNSCDDVQQTLDSCNNSATKAMLTQRLDSCHKAQELCQNANGTFGITPVLEHSVEASQRNFTFMCDGGNRTVLESYLKQEQIAGALTCRALVPEIEPVYKLLPELVSFDWRRSNHATDLFRHYLGDRAENCDDLYKLANEVAYPSILNQLPNISHSSNHTIISDLEAIAGWNISQQFCGNEYHQMAESLRTYIGVKGCAPMLASQVWPSASR